jgi:hypothetical protein
MGEDRYQIARFLREDMAVLVSEAHGEEVWRADRSRRYRGLTCCVSGTAIPTEIAWVPMRAGGHGRVISDGALKSLPKA